MEQRQNVPVSEANSVQGTPVIADKFVMNNQVGEISEFTDSLSLV